MGWIWHLCLANMRQRGIRTALTMLGVVIGVISILSLLALGFGVKERLLSEEMIGGSVTEIEVIGDTDGNRKDRMLTDKKIGEMAKLEYVESAYPVLTVPVVMSYNRYQCYAQLLGVPQEYLEGIAVEAGTLPVESGRKPELLMGKSMLDLFFHENTWASYSEVYGEDEADSSESSESLEEEKKWYDLSGEILDVQVGMEGEGTKYHLSVAGMAGDVSYNTYCNIDVLKKFLRLNAVDGLVQGQPLDKNDSPYHEWIYSSAIVRVDDVEHVDKVLKKLQDMGYQAESNKEYVDTLNKQTKIIQVLLGGMGMIALVVAVIGIGNTMTTAVYDRINEIGILKVLGCNPEELLSLFLLESAILGGVGGLIGILLSYGITEVFVNRLAVEIMELPKGTHLAVIPWWLSAAAFLFAVLLGVFAGFFPARWAAKLKPIEAVKK